MSMRVLAYPNVAGESVGGAGGGALSPLPPAGFLEGRAPYKKF